MNNGFYGGQFTPNSYQTVDQNGGGDGMMGMLGPDGMSQPGMMGGQSLDDIVNTNSNAHQRRKSMPQYQDQDGKSGSDPRRASMMGYGDASGASPLDGFAFDPSTNLDSFMSQSTGFPSNGNNRSNTSSNLGLNTQMANQGFQGMTQSSPAYASPMRPDGTVDADMNSPYLGSSMPMTMDMVDPSLASMVGQDPTNLPFFSPAQHQQFNNSAVSSPIHTTSFSNTPQHLPPAQTSERRSSLSQSRQGYSNDQANSTPDALSSRSQSGAQSTHSSSRQQSQGMTSHPPHRTQKTVSFGPPRPQQMDVSEDPNNHIKVPWSVPAGGFPSSMHNRPHMQTQYKDAYSSTGFDMLNVLMRVATRSNPEINIGSVDLSCAFVVTDAEKDDNPIVYCSENFERLTGYTKHMILGRNCRFLQSPDGNVEAGIKRKYVDDDSVLYLKNMIVQQREAQISLINYRRGGQPFMNLLTMIPVRMEGPEIKFFVGFQVDLVEQPNSVTSKNADGSYTINYQRGLTMPRYIMHTPENTAHMDMGQTITRDDVSTVLTTIGTGESELSKRIWDKVLLENTDDVVHVLSLKGLFLYLSPSCRKVLEYDAGELVGTALSSVCHPSDIVPVTRELKDTSSGTTVNVVFRIRRKNSGYMWFESHGSLHTEQGKGRKCIILVGRERPVYTLSKNDIAAAGGIGENELWTKLSTSGMFLYISSNVRQLLDRQPEELVGTSLQQLMRPESRQEIGRMLSIVRTGKKASAQHEMMNKRGQVLKAFTTIYPGDATEGQKPTFVVAQTRLIRFQRGGSATTPVRTNSGVKQEPNGFATPSGMSNAAGDSTPLSSFSATKYPTTDGAPMTFAGQNGLLLGRQDASLASEENLFDELKTTRSSSWQYELRQMERRNRLLAEEVQGLLAAKKKRKRRKGAGQLQKDCANCHTRTTPEWRRGPSGNRDLCNSCGLRWAKQNGRISPRASSQHSVHSAHSDKASKASASPLQNSTSADQIGTSMSTPSNQFSDKRQNSTNASPNQYSSSSRMDVQQSQGLVSPTGVPPKIDEGIEPD